MTNEMISVRLFLFLRILCFLTLHPKSACLVPPDYCFYQLNTSDCKAKPTPVFYYYKPGSRCELDTWRGCPTYNKFKNEYECSNTCIYRFNLDFNENLIHSISKPEETGLLFSEEDFETDNWESEIKKISNDDAIEINKLLKKVIDVSESNTIQTNLYFINTTVADATYYVTTVTNQTDSKKPQLTTETTKAIETTTKIDTTTVITTPTTADVASVMTIDEVTTENVITTESTVTTDNVITTKSTIPTENVITTESTITTDNVITTKSTIPTENVITTESTITTENVITTEPTTEETTTTLKTTVTTIKGDPDEVIVMKKM